MAIGQYEIAHNAAYTNYSSSITTYKMMAERITFSQPVLLKSFFFYYTGAAQATAQPMFVLTRVSDGFTPLTSTFGGVLNTSAAAGYQEIDASSVNVLLEANVEYSIGFTYTNGSAALARTTATTAAYVAGTSTPSGITSQWWGQMYTRTDTAYTLPTTATSGNLMIKLSVTPNTLPTTPTNVAVTNPLLTQGSAANATWTYNDPDAGAVQNKYQLRWRKVS